MLGTRVAVKRILLGRPRGTRQQRHQLLPKRIALPVFGSVALSSVAYASEEMLAVLARAGDASAALVTPLALAVVGLLALVFGGYRHIVRTYPHGGAYMAARDNLGEGAGLVAAAALLLQYPLTVAVSLAAAVAAVSSAAPELGRYPVLLGLGLLVAVTVVNLRGLREIGTLPALAIYAFCAALLALIATGLTRCLLGVAGCPGTPSAGAAMGGDGVGPWVMLQAFAIGAVVLSGIDTTANSVTAFRYPQSEHAARTLARMGVVAGVLFVGVSYLASATGAAPDAGRTVLAGVALALFGEGAGFLLVQGLTVAVLLVAAHTSSGDLPRLASILARDRWLPRQYLARGDRLMFSTALTVVALAAAVLLVVSGASVTALAPLYVLSVFTTFALGLGGMARRAWHHQGEKDAVAVALPAAGAVLGTGVAAVVAVAWFLEGAWAVAVGLAALVVAMRQVRRHYREVAERLRVGGVAPQAAGRHHAVILLDRVDEPAARALSYALATQPASIRAIGVPLPGSDLRTRWSILAPDVPLELLRGAREPGVVSALAAALTAEADRNGPESFTTALVPETLSRSWVQQLRQHRLALRLKALLQQEGRVVVADVTSPFGGPGPYTVEEPAEHHVVVLVSAVDAASVRALAYAETLHATSVRALGVSLDPERSTQLLSDWAERGLTTPVEVVDSPFRSLSAAVRDFVQGFAPDGRHTVVTCVLPTFVVEHPLQSLLHNQSAMLLRSVLLFERGVVATSVPYPLEPPAPAEGAGPASLAARDRAAD